MGIVDILDRLLVPRANGSDGLERASSFIQETLRETGAQVVLHDFSTTPYGFQLLWTAVVLVLCLYAIALLRRRLGWAVTLAVLAASLPILELWWMLSPVSGLVPGTGSNVVASFACDPGAPTLVLSAHYDTTTHFGDHFLWNRWARWLPPAAALSIATPLVGIWLRRRGRALATPIVLAVVLAVLVPNAAMMFFFAAGPLLREPSPGALDNGGSVAVLLRLAERLDPRPSDAPTCIDLVFLASEEERGLGSWSYAKSLAQRERLAVVNLETLGASRRIVYAPRDGLEPRLDSSPVALIEHLDAAVRDSGAGPLRAQPFPPGTYTDGHSFLARGVPAVTLTSAVPGGYPRRLHSAHDSRDRLSLEALEHTVSLLEAVVLYTDRHPEALDFARLDARR